jgi:hypothetical protein
MHCLNVVSKYIISLLAHAFLYHLLPSSLLLGFYIQFLQYFYSGAHAASYKWITRPLSLGVKQLGCEADHSPPSSTKVKNGGAIPPLLHTSL